MQLIKDQEGIRELINEVLTKKESEDLEFKHASGGFPGSFWDTTSCCSTFLAPVGNNALCSGQRTRIMARLSETLRVTINALVFTLTFR